MAFCAISFVWPSRSSSTISEALFREPVGFPAGLPDLLVETALYYQP
jgi:hypothetical protein